MQTNVASHCVLLQRTLFATVHRIADYCSLPCSISECLILPQLQCPCILFIDAFASSKSVDLKYGCDGVRQVAVDGSRVKVVTSAGLDKVLV
jgi:hypothetical protein